MSDRCKGHCCRAFIISLPFDELKARASTIIDGAQIAEMLIELGNCDAGPHGAPLFDANDKPTRHHYYTCKNFDRASGDCHIYETRPEMCRDHPTGSGCPYPDCEWTFARVDAQPDVSFDALLWRAHMRRMDGEDVLKKVTERKL